MVATTEATQPFRLTELDALADSLIDGAGTVGETLETLREARDVLVKIRAALGPEHHVKPVDINVHGGFLVVSVELPD